MYHESLAESRVRRNQRKIFSGHCEDCAVNTFTVKIILKIRAENNDNSSHCNDCIVHSLQHNNAANIFRQNYCLDISDNAGRSLPCRTIRINTKTMQRVNQYRKSKSIHY